MTWVRAQWDRTGGFALLAAGAVLLLSGWVGVSGTSDRPAQLSFGGRGHDVLGPRSNRGRKDDSRS